VDFWILDGMSEEVILGIQRITDLRPERFLTTKNIAITTDIDEK
jgi:hypothetical protein